MLETLVYPGVKLKKNGKDSFRQARNIQWPYTISTENLQCSASFVNRWLRWFYSASRKTQVFHLVSVCMVDCVWNVIAHAQKPDFVFRRKGRVHLNRRGRQFSRLLAAELCASAVVMLDTPYSEVAWRVQHGGRTSELLDRKYTAPAYLCGLLNYSWLERIC